jgi:hypothetical protein
MSKDVCAIHHSYLSEFLARVREEKHRVTTERCNETEAGVEKERLQERVRTRRRVTRRCDRVRRSGENYEYHNDRSFRGKIH